MPAPAINYDYPARWHSPRDGAPVLAIIAHGTGGTDSRRYLARGGDLIDGSDRKVSIHVLIQKDGTIYRMVADERTANHAGGVLVDGRYSSVLTVAGQTYRGAQVNRHTLGFELENRQNGVDPYTDAQLWAMGWQIARWRQRYGVLPLFRHAQLDRGRRSDPQGLTVDAMELWARRAAADAPRRDYRVSAPAGARVRRGRAANATILRTLPQGEAWAGYETPGQRLTLDGFGTSSIWVCDEAGACVWRPLLTEVV